MLSYSTRHTKSFVYMRERWKQSHSKSPATGGDNARPFPFLPSTRGLLRADCAQMRRHTPSPCSTHPS